MKIIGFDPASYRNLGWAICNVGKKLDCVSGTFTMPKSKKDYEALWPMYLAVDGLLEEQKPDIVIIEKTSSFAGGFITGQVSQGIGVLLICCVKRDVDVAFVYPTHVKKVVSGKGKATKTQMKEATKDLLSQYCKEPVTFDSSHACDATSNILCWLIDNDKLRKNNDGTRS